MSQNTGRVYITVAGKRQKSDGAKINIGGPERNGEVIESGVAGYTEKDTIPFVEFELKHDSDVKVRDIQGMKDVTISADTDTGRSYVFRNAWCAKAHEIDKGKVAVRFEAMSCEEV